MLSLFLLEEREKRRKGIKFVVRNMTDLNASLISMVNYNHTFLLSKMSKENIKIL